MRKAVDQASQAEQAAGATAGAVGSQANQAYATAMPVLSRMAQGGYGYTPQQMADMLTAGEQGAGGAASGITGQANLQAARTRNTGGFSTALDEVARQRMRQLSQNALNVRLGSAQQAQQNQQAALGGLERMWGTGLGAQTNLMGQQARDVEAQAQAGSTGWFQNMVGFLGALNKPAAG